jgi:glutamyl/glutaminyl-tRNA synthetase
MTFWCTQERARAAGGNLILRIEDLDVTRCRPEFFDAIIEDLKWFGFEWSEGPDVGGAFAPYVQSARRKFYLDSLEKLCAAGSIYPCRCSRRDVLEAAVAPHDENREPIYPGTCRPVLGPVVSAASTVAVAVPAASETQALRLPPQSQPAGINWRFRVPDGEQMKFVDERLGLQTAIAGKDFGDFIIWRRDNVPAYQLAVVVDDLAMQITEVVRGEDLLLSTFRQLLLYRALNLNAPKFYHAPLLLDGSGRRLAKRNAALSLRALRESGAKPEEIRQRYL